MNPGTRVKTPRGLGVLENIHDDGTCVVRLINQTEWPFPEWIFVQRNQVKFAFKLKPDLTQFEEAPF